MAYYHELLQAGERLIAYQEISHASSLAAATPAGAARTMMARRQPRRVVAKSRSSFSVRYTNCPSRLIPDRLSAHI